MKHFINITIIFMFLIINLISIMYYHKKISFELIEYINSVHNLIEEQEQFILDYSENENVIDAIHEGINYEEYIENETKLIKKYNIKINNNK